MMSSAPDIPPGMMPHIEVIRVSESLTEAVAISYGLLNYVQESPDLMRSGRSGPKNVLVKVSHELVDLLGFIPSFDTRILPRGTGYTISCFLPPTIGGQGWTDWSNLRNLLGSVLFVLSDEKVHLDCKVDEASGLPEVTQANDLPENVRTVCPNAVQNIELPKGVGLPCAKVKTLDIAVDPLPQVGIGPDLCVPSWDGGTRELVSRSQFSVNSPMGESIRKRTDRGKGIILSFPTRNQVPGILSTFKEWIMSGHNRPPTLAGDPLQVSMPGGILLSKNSLENLSGFFRDSSDENFRRKRLIDNETEF